MAISFVAAGAQVAVTTTSFTPALPAGWQPNDYAIAFLYLRAFAEPIGPAPSGWTLLASRVAALDRSVYAYGRVLQSGDGDPTFTCSADLAGGFIAAWRGVSTTNPSDATPVTSEGASSNTFTPTGITTATNGARVVSYVSTTDNNAIGYSALNSFTDRASGSAYDTTTGADFAQAMADIAVATAGAQTCPTFLATVNGPERWQGITLALRPAPSTVTASASLTGQGTMTVAASSNSGGTTFGSASWTAEGVMTVTARTRKRQPVPRRQVLWVSDLSGVQVNTIT